MPIDVRTVTEAEFPAWVKAMRDGFLSAPSEGDAERRLETADLSRTWGAFDGERIVGTLRSWACELTMPGGSFVTTSALTNVTVSPTHRRRGLLTRMMEPELRDAAERGEVAGILIAAEYPIYGRFGYGPAAGRATLTVDAAAATFPGPRTGSVELIDLATLRKEGPPLYERVRRTQAGTITRQEHWWDDVCQVRPLPDDKPFKGFVALGRDDGGQPDGYVRYTVDDHWQDFRPRITLEVEELLAVTPAAEERLWRYLCEIDWVKTVKAADRSTRELLPWFVGDARVVQESVRVDFLWVRPLDVPGLLASRTYLTPGRIVLEVADPLGYAPGRIALEGGPDGATASATTEPADLTLEAATLGAVVLGGPTVREMAASGRIDVHDGRALDVADAMFRTADPPWCTTWF
jgi:predicted acetyltransferase